MKKINNQNQYYLNNRVYTNFLDSQSKEVFAKYIKEIRQLISSEMYFLDVGCGTGTVLQELGRHGYTHLSGIEVSQSSVQVCKKKGLDCKIYDGLIFPYEDKSFNLVGSINVLEHSHDPIKLLNEKLRVVKDDGYIIVICPNFLSITNNYHKHTRGLINKLKNLFILVRIALDTHTDIAFGRMEITRQDHFQPDDDAINITNPIQIMKWAEHNNLQTLYSSAFQVRKYGLLNLIDKTPLKILFGSCFYVFKK